MKRHATPLVAALLTAPLLTGSLLTSTAHASTEVERIPVCNQVVTIELPSGDFARVPHSSRHGFQCSLRQGDLGDAVKTLQDSVNQCHSGTLTVDGNYGPSTHAAVRAMQKTLSLPQDGIVGPATLRAMQHVTTGLSAEDQWYQYCLEIL